VPTSSMNDELCPDSVPRNVPTRAWFSGHAQARTPDRPCLPARRRPQVHLVREVPAAGRPAGPEAHRAGVDRARAPSDGPLHEAHRGSLVARRARRGDAGRRPASCRPARRSPTPPRSSCGTSSTIARSSPRR